MERRFPERGTCRSWLLELTGCAGAHKALTQLNPYLTREQIDSRSVKTIDGDLLDDGLLLWNRTMEAWQEALRSRFRFVQLEDVYFPECDQHNHMFLYQTPSNVK